MAFRLTGICLAMLFGACAAGGGVRSGDGGVGDGAVDGNTCSTDMDCEDDGLFCNGTPRCEGGVCVEGTPPDCGDSVTCTVDTCLETTDECQNTPDSTLCPEETICRMGMGCVAPNTCEFDTDCSGGDGLFCNGDEVCLEGLCQSPGLRGCDDDNSCTIDECVEDDDACVNMAASHLEDPDHCGATGANDCVVCAMPTDAQVHVVRACEAGACGFICEDGFADSDDDLSNGCECMTEGGVDDPDESFEDTNCDGIDGDLSRGILVSITMGNDTASCGLDLLTPCRTLVHATTRAITESRRDLFVMAGRYEGVVVLRDGIRVFGGYDTSWVRDAHSEDGHATVLVGALDASEMQYIAVQAHDLAVAPTLENLVIEGPDAMMPGLSSYAVHVDNTTDLIIERCLIEQGDGADGMTGMEGQDATVVVAAVGMSGGQGGAADTFITPCSNEPGAAGPAGVNSCSGGLPVAAGAGGLGGPMDNFCLIVCDGSSCNALPGLSGDPAAQFMSGGFGSPGTGGAGRTICGPGVAGMNGRVQNGGSGTGAADARGSVTGAYWIGGTGQPGGVGQHGGGGGGGGGSGGCDDGVLGANSHGAGGGGGGAGGCAARSGGGGGGAGGGSFGVFALSSTVHVTATTFRRGTGGEGGEGGEGGRGQSGGPGGLGGLPHGTSLPGGAGGTGGHGGHGGGGGGGAGGLSYGIFSLSSTVEATSCSYEGGAAGNAGPGGESAPSAPVAERDGTDGEAGTVGSLGEVFTCATASGC